jgi:hypothetical protein
MYFKADFFKLRDLTLRVPMEWAIPKTSSATLSLTVQNWARWLNDDMRIFDPEMGERNTVSESGHRLPPDYVLRRRGNQCTLINIRIRQGETTSCKRRRIE